MRLIICSVLLLFISAGLCVETNELPRIAIVGGGIGGASCSYFLQELFGQDLYVDVYEKGEIGGRLKLAEIGGRLYEAGASIIHPRNEYMVNFTRMLGLHVGDSPHVRFGVFDGKQFVLDGSEWKPILIGQLLWRYGWDIFRMNNFVKKLIGEFSHIYAHQDKGMAFTTTEKLIQSLSPSFPDLLTHSLAEELKRNGMSDTYIKEVARGALRTNYGQEEDIHALVGSISMAGIQPGLWSVHGGNPQIAEKLLQRPKVKVIRSEVAKVTVSSYKHYPKFVVETKDGKKEDYCIVIIATPLHEGTSNLKFDNLSESLQKFKGQFHRTVSNFVKGQINITKFGMDSEDRFPQAMLTSGLGLPFNSIGEEYPVDFSLADAEKLKKETKVWKLFSKDPLTRQQLNDLFVTIEETKQVDFLAYPHYESSMKDIPPFQLSPQLYYISGIEWMGSTLETSAIGARNVALLAYHTWFEKTHNIDRPLENVVKDKTEL